MNYTKLFCILFAFALPVALLAQGNDAAKPNPDLEKAIIKFEHDMSAALTKPDADAAAKMLADSFYAVNPDGTTQGKTQFVADLKSRKFKLESNELDDMKVHVVTADMAIVTYRSTDKGDYDGHDLSGQYRWLDVLAKRNGAWQFIVSQGTKIEAAKK
ncbi:MAG TPA: nuclear transport factor 2 family protein [Chthoniobacterales bacterium]|nr:nuclear transport factor 2 family protein [Chthoniobacterales bacterium]